MQESQINCLRDYKFDVQYLEYSIDFFGSFVTIMEINQKFKDHQSYTMYYYN